MPLGAQIPLPEGAEIRDGAGLLEERMENEISEDFDAKEEDICGLIKKLSKGDGDMNALKEKAREVLSKEWRYEIQRRPANDFANSYELKISSAKVERELDFDDIESIVNALQEHLERLCEARYATQEKLMKICNERRKEADDLEERINGELEEAFIAEDLRIYNIVEEIQNNINSEDPDEVEALIRKAQLALLKNQRYTLSREGPQGNCALVVTEEASLESIDFEERKPIITTPSLTERREISLSFAFFSEDEVEVLRDARPHHALNVGVELWEKDSECAPKAYTVELAVLDCDGTVRFRGAIIPGTKYCLRVRILHQGMSTQWSNEDEFTTPEFKRRVWKECPDDVHEKRKYSVDVRDPRIATFIGRHNYGTIIGNTPLPLNKVTSWSIKILKSRWNNGHNIYIGVAPSDINQNEGNNYDECGWYIHCGDSTLWSGPPHNYSYPGKDYGPRKEWGQYVHTGDSVDVVMDTTKGELSFVVDGVNLGVAYEGIPLDRPLVPCAILYYNGDSVELNP